MESLLEYWYIPASVTISGVIYWIGKIYLFKEKCNHIYKMFEMYKPMTNERVTIISKALKDNNKDEPKDEPNILPKIPSINLPNTG